MNISQIQTALEGIMVIIFGVISVDIKVKVVPYLEKIVPVVLDKMTSEIGQVRFDRMEKGANLLWNGIVKEISKGSFVGDAESRFENLLTQRYPKITPADLSLLSKGIVTIVAPIVPTVDVAVKDVEAVVETTPIVASEPESIVSKDLDKVDNVAAVVTKYFNAAGVELIEKPVAPGTPIL